MKWASKVATVLLPALFACEDGFLVIRTGVFAGSGRGFVNATLNDDSWSSSQASASSVGGGIIIIFGTSRDHFGRDVELRLVMRTTVGSAAQVIGDDNIVSASVEIRDGAAQFWTARTGRGSGTLTFTSISADQVEGTFEFVAHANDSFASPATYRIARGTFNVPIQ
jgi:hypothetical protein